MSVRNIMSYRHGIVLLVFSFFFVCRPASARCSEMDIRSDTLEYDEANKYMVASGSVCVTWGDKQLYADRAAFWIDSKHFVADGSIRLVEKDALLRGDRITYSLSTSTGEISSPSGYFDDWTFSAGKAVRTSEKEYRIANNTRFTSCGLKKPHYTIRASGVKILPGKRVVFYNPVFFVEGVPVFYLPAISQGLGPHRDSLEVQPGYNNSDGFIAKVIYGYKLTDYAYTKLYLDYYSIRGIGKGAEYTYYIPDKVKGSIYGYHIKENTTGNERWTFLSSYWQRFNSLWTGQGELSFQSDTTFGNSYFQNNWSQTRQEVSSNFSLTRQSASTNLRFTANRVDAYDDNTKEFAIKHITVPRIDYTVFPQKGKLPFYIGSTFYLQNMYTKTADYYAQTGGFDTNIYRYFRITRDMTLTPRVGITENWADSTSKTDSTDILQTYYYSTTNLRLRPSYWADWDFTHNYRIRTRKNAFLPDIDANDFGKEANSLAFQNSMYFSYFTLRNSLSYDMRIGRNEIIEDWRQKLSPLVNELTWTPYYFLSLYVREENKLYPTNELNSVQTDLSYGQGDNYFFGLGTIYRSIYPDEMDFNVRFGFCLPFLPNTEAAAQTPRWKFDYRAQTVTLNNFSEFQPTSEELNVYRDLHCWQAKVRFRRTLNVDRSYNNEIYAQVELRFSASNRESMYSKQAEKELYPWR